MLRGVTSFSQGLHRPPTALCALLCKDKPTENQPESRTEPKRSLLPGGIPAGGQPRREAPQREAQAVSALRPVGPRRPRRRADPRVPSRLLPPRRGALSLPVLARRAAAALLSRAQFPSVRAGRAGPLRARLAGGGQRSCRGPGRPRPGPPAAGIVPSVLFFINLCKSSTNTLKQAIEYYARFTGGAQVQKIQLP